MTKRKIDPRHQFSKWLARSSALFLVFYLTALLVLIYFRPEAAIPCIYLAIIVAVIRVSDAGFYTKNSLTEKMLLTLLDKAKIDLSLKSIAKNVITSTKNTTSSSNEISDLDDDETIEGGEG